MRCIAPKCIEAKCNKKQMKIEPDTGGILLEDRIKRVYCPMTETGFYILFCLQVPQHGYGISQQVKQMTGNRVVISPGTMYGTLSKMEKDRLITFVREEEKRKLYCITEAGKEVLTTEIQRIERLYKNSQGEWIL